MKNKAEIIGVLNWSDIETKDGNSLACGIIFDFFPNVSMKHGSEYRITVSRSRFEGAESFIFDTKGKDLDGRPIIYWRKNPKEERMGRYIYKSFREVIGATLTEKQIQNKSIIRWVKLEKI